MYIHFRLFASNDYKLPAGGWKNRNDLMAGRVSPFAMPTRPSSLGDGRLEVGGHRHLAYGRRCAKLERDHARNLPTTLQVVKWEKQCQI